MGRKIFGGGATLVGVGVLLTALIALFSGHVSAAARGGAVSQLYWKTTPARFLVAVGIRAALGSMFLAGGVTTLRMEDEEEKKARVKAEKKKGDKPEGGAQP